MKNFILIALVSLALVRVNAQQQDVPLQLAFQDLCWSPDGKQIVFSTIYRKADWSDYNPDKWTLILLNLKTNKARKLANGAIFGSFSPDGNFIAYGKQTENDRDIFVQNLSTGEERRLTNDPASDSAPSWSPDGQLIVFNSKRTGKTEIFVMNAGGSNIRQITQSGGHSSYNPQWSPNSNKIVYYFEKGDHRDQVWLTDSEGSFYQNLTADTLHNYFAGWAPGGIIYATVDDQIFTMKENGTGKLAVENVRSHFARISPDGKHIAFFDNKNGALVVQRYPSGKHRKAVFSEKNYLNLIK